MKALLGIATSIGSELSATDLEYVLKTYTTKNAIKTNQQDSAYYELHLKLKRAKKLNNLDGSIYTISKSEGNRFFYGISSSDKPYYWHPFTDFPDELSQGYDQGGVIPLYDDDGNGHLSAFFPVKNAIGETLAVVLVNRLQSDFRAEVQSELKRELLFSLGGVSLLAVGLFLLLKRILDEEEVVKKRLKVDAEHHASQFDKQRKIIEELTTKERTAQEALKLSKEEHNKSLHALDHARVHEIELESGLEELKQRLNAIIEYSKGIQQVLIPNQELFRKVFPDSFVLFKPKDEISGDFYFCTELGDKVFIATVDCTGDGVPGAFMNLLAHNFFHQIIEGSNIIEPNLILDEMHSYVTKLFKQDSNGNQDGMDIALCVFDRKKQCLEFSGAQRPIVYIEDNKLHTIKGDPFSVGGRHRFHDKKFSKTEISLKPGTECYLYSDGLQDQMGFAFDVIETRKFGKKRMEQLFNEVHRKSMEKQKELINNRFNDWRKDETQVDDILIVGFRFD